MKKSARPFRFDQAVGSSSHIYKRTSQISVGELKPELQNSLYSPTSACDIVSAVRLKKEHGIVATAANQILARISDGKPVRRLKEIDNVL